MLVVLVYKLRDNKKSIIYYGTMDESLFTQLLKEYPPTEYYYVVVDPKQSDKVIL